MTSDLDAMSQRYPVRFVPSGILSIDGKGLPVVERVQGDPGTDNAMSLVFIDGPMLKHYFHFAELLLGAFFIYSEYFQDYKVTRLYVGRQQWNNPAHNFAQQGMMKAVFPDAEVIEGSGGPVTNALVVDRWLYHKSETIRCTFNQFLEPFGQIGRAWAPSFRDLVWSHAGVRAEPRSRPIRATHIMRSPPRAFTPEVEERVKAIFRDAGAEVADVDFSHMPWIQQVQSAAAVNCLFSVHGNGLTNLLWMPPGSTVFEFFPVGTHHYPYQLFCELFQISYFGLHDNNAGGAVWRDFSRTGGAYGGRPWINSPVTTVPWYLLEECISGYVSRCGSIGLLRSDSGTVQYCSDFAAAR